MRFECTIMHVVESNDTTTSDETDDQSEPLEMRPHAKKEGQPMSPRRPLNLVEQHGKSRSGGATNDWMEEEERLNKGHRATESFVVLNELVVVSLCPKTTHVSGSWTESIFEHIRTVWG